MVFWTASPIKWNIRDAYFFWKERYIKVLHHLETFLTSAQTAHYLKQFRKDPDTLMTVNPKTRPPVMCPRKKVHGHLCQKMRCRYKHVLRIRLLKDSPRMEPVCSRENNLQKRSLFGIKKTHCFCRARQTNTRLSHPKVLTIWNLLVFHLANSQT